MIIMKPKVFYFAFAMAIALLSACTSEEVMNEPAMTRGIQESVTKAYSFEKITESNNWKRYNSLEEMKDACQIPQEILSSMTTEALVETCMNYPLYLVYTAYNNELDGIKTIMNSFNGFKELASRADANNKIVDYYSNLNLNQIVENIKVKKIVPIDGLNTVKLGFIELFLATNLDSKKNDISDKLKTSVLQQLEVKTKYPEIFDNSSIVNSRLLLAANDGKDIHALYNEMLYSFDYKETAQTQEEVATTRSYEEATLISSFYVNTFWGKSVEAQQYSTMSYERMVELDSVYTHRFPQAEMVAHSSNAYNCHSYAWNIADGGNQCWINARLSSETSGNANLSKYWTNDYYAETQNSSLFSTAPKIYYYNSDHSAVNNGDGTYISKWGKAPLMIHAPGYGPYDDMTSRKYYIQTPLSGSISTSQGGIYYIGDSDTFTLPSIATSRSDLNYQWSFVNMQGVNAVSSGNILVYNTTSSCVPFECLSKSHINVTCQVRQNGSNILVATYTTSISILRN